MQRDRRGWEDELGWERSRREVAEAREDAKEARNRVSRLVTRLRALEQEKFSLLASQELLSRRCHDLQGRLTAQSLSQEHQENARSEVVEEKMRVLELEHESQLRDEIIALLHADHRSMKAMHSAKIQEFNDFMESAKQKLGSVERLKDDLLSDFRSLSSNLSSRLEEVSTRMKQQVFQEKTLRIRKEEELSRLKVILKEHEMERTKLQSDIAQCKRESSKVREACLSYALVLMMRRAVRRKSQTIAAGAL
eukprot:90358-Hanusia_phi.AAC.3